MAGLIRKLADQAVKKTAFLKKTGLPGVSQNTQTMLDRYSGGYKASGAVIQAQDYLKSVVAGKPGAYKNNYKQQLNDIYDSIVSRPAFSYDAAKDPMYRQYREQYSALGRQAMMDTAAQAAALTGGYGNSYGVTAGNQAYQAYLSQLNSAAPELYRMALERYRMEGDNLRNSYDMTAELENRDYQRWKDDMNAWQAERDYAEDSYWNRYNADYDSYQDMLDYWSGAADRENAQYNADREYDYTREWNESQLAGKQASEEWDMAYDQALEILKTGKLPSTDLLEKARITVSDAQKLAKYYAQKSGSKSSSGTKSSSSTKKTSSSGQKASSTVSSKVVSAVKAAAAVSKSAGSQNTKAASGGGTKSVMMTK